MDHNHEEKIEDSEIKSWKAKLIWSWVFTIPVVFIFGWPTIKAGIRGLFTFYFNMDSLISLGTVIAYLTGLIAFTGVIQDYSGVAAMIMAFFTTGKFVEAQARGRSSQEIRKLLELGAKTAR